MKLFKRQARLLVKNSFFVMFASKRAIVRFVRLLPNRYQLFVLSGMSNARIFSVNLNGLAFKLQSSFNDDHFQSLILNDFQNWEKNSIKSWIEAISKGDTVIDVGSYLGVYSILAAKAGARNVISYEPNPNTYQSLQVNIRLNNLQNTIFPRELGLSDFDGNEPLFHPPGREMSSGSRFRSSFAEQEFAGWQQESSVMVATLDKEIYSLGITRVSGIKIDAEGHEMQVLKGAVKTLTSNRPFLIIEFQTQEHLEEANNFLTTLGYDIPLELDAIVQNSKHPMNVNIARNYLYKPSLEVL